MSTALLEVKNLKMHFPIEEGLLFKKQVGAIRAIDGISFEIKAGETLGLVGESGCGKSTTARTIAQLYKATEGEIIFNGRDLVSLDSRELLSERKNIQMVFQDPYASLNPRMTVTEIIAEPLIIFKNRGLMTISKKEITERAEFLM